MKVSEIMKKDFLVLSSDTTLADAAKRLSEKGQSEAPVVSNGRFLGMLLTSDIAAVIVRTGLFGRPKQADVGRPSAEPVARHMGSHRTWLTPDADMLSAFLLLIHRNVDVIPVLDSQKKIIGVVRAEDIRREMARILSSGPKSPAKSKAAPKPQKEEPERFSAGNTAIDSIVHYVQSKGAASAEEVAKACGLKLAEVEEYAASLERYGLLKAEYSIFGKMKLKKIQ